MLSGERFDENPRITKATPRLAPELSPRTYGPAMGFLKSVCICNPLIDRAIPTKSEVMAFGNLNFNKIVSVTSPVSLNSALKISTGLILTDPRKRSSMKNISRRNINPIKISLDLSGFDR
jgi:hypothetical protein